MKKAVILSPLLICLVWPTLAQLVYEDRTYEETIRTVQFYAAANAQDTSFPPVIRPGETNLVIEFDDLQPDRQNYYVKVLPCTWDWQEGMLKDLDFMSEYNEFNITDYAFSSNTLIPYVHYRYQVPPPMIAGNYLLIVYRDGDRSNLILSRRFMVYNQMVNLVSDPVAGTATLRKTRQPLQFDISYNGIEVFNPLEYFHITIRQNQRWNNIREGVSPSFLRDDQSIIEFRAPDPDAHFAGGNEFRFVDFRSLNYPGMNVDRLDRSTKPPQLYVAYDKPRTDEAYAQYNDMNGGFVIANRDYAEPRITGQYVNVTFTLRPTQSLGKVYVVGAFNHWQISPESQMKPQPDGSLTMTTLLKQGFYNYQYVTAGANTPDWSVEGSHFETENVYEVMVYLKSLQPNTDLLVGYFVLPVNRR